MAARFGIFGDTTASLQRNGFFDWFQLTPAQDQAPGGVAIYRPDGPAFRALVSLAAEASAAGRLQTLTLSVARSFIDDPRQGAFARDVAKSFLEALGAARDADLAPVVAEIFYRGGGPMIMRGEAPALPPAPSPAYRVFAGESPEWRGSLGALGLRFADDGAAFTIEARSDGTGRSAFKDWFARLLGRA